MRVRMEVVLSEFDHTIGAAVEHVFGLPEQFLDGVCLQDTRAAVFQFTRHEAPKPLRRPGPAWSQTVPR